MSVNRELPGTDLGYWLQCLSVADPFQRLHAATVLGLMGEAAQGAVPALVEALRDDDLAVRRMVTAALGEIGPAARTAVPVLVAALRDRSPAVRRRAAYSLGELGGAAFKAVPALAAALQDTDDVTGRWAAFSLGEIGPKAVSAAPDLVEMFRHPSIITRVIAGVALRRLGPDALPFLHAALKDADPRVRRHAVTTLGKSSGEPARLLRAVVTAIGDVDASVREAAFEALERLGEPAAGPVLSGPTALRPVLLPVD